VLRGPGSGPCEPMSTIIPFPGRRELSSARGEHDPVRVAYDALAPAYDAFTADHRHELWVPAIGRLARRHGLAGRRVLDVACGTGKSFLPLLERGYAVTACDLSPEMARRAARKAPAARVRVADMRELPVLGSFDLVTCLDDALNYLLHGDELHDTLAGFARQLEPGGLAVWDVNTLSLVRSSFAGDWVAERGEWFFCWRGTATPAVAAGAVVEARVDAFRRRGTTWTRTTSRHRQRHWPLRELERAAEEVGLEILEVLGQRRGAELEPEIDEDRHIKAVFIARRGH
jgi:SAM-dependent methyltransferase